MSQHTLTRSELYDQVWSEPMSRLARTHGLSDVGLAKLCRKLNVPCPPRGYWAKLRAGQHPRQAPLPAAEDDTEITFQKSDDREDSNSADRDELARAHTLYDIKIEVAATLRGAHRLVAQANEELAGAKTDSDGMLVAPDTCPLAARVSKKQLHRTMLIYSALLKALEQNGCKVSRGPTVEIDGPRVSFSIREDVQSVSEAPEDHDLSGEYQFGHSRRVQRRVPAGTLTLEILDPQAWRSSGCRKRWRDTKRARLEDNLTKFVVGLVQFAAHQQELSIAEFKEALRQREAEAQRQAEAKERAERRRLQQAEQARVDGLITQLNNWRTSRDLRQFIEVVREAHTAAGSPLEPDSEMGQWLNWAAAQADRFDPLRASPPSILDEKIPDEPSRYSW